MNRSPIASSLSRPTTARGRMARDFAADWKRWTLGERATMAALATMILVAVSATYLTQIPHIAG
jgi:hypothetical protein